MMRFGLSLVFLTVLAISGGVVANLLRPVDDRLPWSQDWEKAVEQAAELEGFPVVGTDAVLFESAKRALPESVHKMFLLAPK